MVEKLTKILKWNILQQHHLLFITNSPYIQFKAAKGSLLNTSKTVGFAGNTSKPHDYFLIFFFTYAECVIHMNIKGQNRDL